MEYYKDPIVLNGTFDFPSIYRGYPSPELDAAWRAITQEGEDCITSLINICITGCQLNSGVLPTRLTREQLSMIGKGDTSSKVKFLEEDGGGYMASLEVTHQLHCLVNAEPPLIPSTGNFLTSSPRIWSDDTPTASTMRRSTRLSLRVTLYSVCI